MSKNQKNIKPQNTAENKQKNVKQQGAGNNTEEYDPEPYFEILDHYFTSDNQILVKHHIDSYNYFIDVIIPSILQGDNIISEKIGDKKIIRIRLTFENNGIKPPLLDNDEDLLFPLDAIQKTLSYSAKYTSTVTQWKDEIDIETGEIKTVMIGNPEKDVTIAKIPMMVKSKYCNLMRQPTLDSKHCKYDPGGYFIIGGNEKVVLSLEAMVYRKPLVFAKKEQNAFIYTVQSQSRIPQKVIGGTQTFTIRMKKDQSLVLTNPQFREVSIFILMRALGLETDNDITNAILDTEREINMKNQLSVCYNASGTKPISREEAIEILMNSLKSSKQYSDSDPKIRAAQKRKYLMKILGQLLPHVVSHTGDSELDMLYKAYFIGYMIHKLLKCYLSDSKDVEEYRGCDDRDHLVNKRIELTGNLLGGLFEQLFKRMLSECTRVFRPKSANDQKTPNIIQNIKSTTIEQGLRQALSTGQFSPSRKGISQMLNRLNNIHTLSYMRRVISPTVDAATNKMTSPRRLHPSHYGTYCPFETPEGPKTGLIRNLSLLAGVTTNMDSQIPKIMNYLKSNIISLENVTPQQLHRQIKVFVNENLLGVAKNILKIYTDMRNMRFAGEIERTVSLVFDFKNREFKIDTTGGRFIRPYLTVENGKLLFEPKMLEDVTSWEDFLVKHPKVIEFLDKDEEQFMMLAVYPTDILGQNKIMKKKAIKDQDDLDKINKTNRYDGNVFVRYTHCEIHPSMILGLMSSNMPFANHNHGPRGVFHYNQSRQAMGISTSDYRERTDITYLLYHPQIPIVASRTSKYTNTHIFPTGENCIVAIMSYYGYNQEDSLLMCESAVQKGLFRAQYFTKKIEIAKKNPAASQPSLFMKPDRNKVDHMRDSHANYNKLPEDGIIKEETPINDGDVIIGIVTPKPISKDGPKENEKLYKDSSVIYKSLVPGAIDKVFTGVNSDNYKFVKIRIRSERIPMIGDKFASKGAQKGTIGFKPHRADMPFTEDGLIPDIIINPNCIPKRMTIGQLLECILGKLCAVKGVFGDATPFGGVDVDKINAELVALGYDAWGSQTMYNGMTGIKMETKIFIGPTYYHRQKQMVGDKTHSRARGVVQILTHQPTEGRSRDGGLRFGEMERDAIGAHGTAQFLKERMVDNSDTYTCYVCNICGQFAHKKPRRNYYICASCNNTTRISKIVIPYAFKLCLQELKSINIMTRIRTFNNISSYGTNLI